MQKYWSDVQQSIELGAVLRLPGRRAGWKELRAQAASYVAQGHGVVNVNRQRLVESHCRGERRVVAMLRHVANRAMALPLAADGTLGLGTKKM